MESWSGRRPAGNFTRTTRARVIQTKMRVWRIMFSSYLFLPINILSQLLDNPCKTIDNIITVNRCHEKNKDNYGAYNSTNVYRCRTRLTGAENSYNDTSTLSK